jgi:hypothetical protein
MIFHLLLSGEQAYKQEHYGSECSNQRKDR